MKCKWCNWACSESIYSSPVTRLIAVWQHEGVCISSLMTANSLELMEWDARAHGAGNGRSCLELCSDWHQSEHNVTLITVIPNLKQAFSCWREALNFANRCHIMGWPFIRQILGWVGTLSSKIQVTLLAPISSVKITEARSPCQVNHMDFFQRAT